MWQYNTTVKTTAITSTFPNVNGVYKQISNQQRWFCLVTTQKFVIFLTSVQKRCIPCVDCAQNVWNL